MGLILKLQIIYSLLGKSQDLSKLSDTDFSSRRQDFNPTTVAVGLMTGKIAWNKIISRNSVSDGHGEIS
jgi:hypothetical protein